MWSKGAMTQWWSLEIEVSLFRNAPETLCCVLGNDTLTSALFVVAAPIIGDSL